VSKYSTAYKEDGVAIIPNAVNIELIDTVVEAIKKFKKTNEELLISNELLVDGMLQRVVNMQQCCPGLDDIFVQAMNSGKDVVDAYGEATLYTSLFFEKGSEQSLHRDTPYFYSGTSEGYMGAWVALQDTDETNGTLQVVKGSHKLPEPDLTELVGKYFETPSQVPSSHTQLFNDFNERLIETATSKGLVSEPINMKKGDLVVWNPSALHGGLPHKDLNKTRLSFVMHITPKNIPMLHMDYFFNRDKPIPVIDRLYRSYKNKLIHESGVVDFLHKKTFTPEELGIFN
jgi:phytanoyl-CoA hydroxylase